MYSNKIHIVTNKIAFKTWILSLPKDVQDNIVYACGLCVHDKYQQPYILVSHKVFIHSKHFLDLRFKDQWYLTDKFVTTYKPNQAFIKVIN